MKIKELKTSKLVSFGYRFAYNVKITYDPQKDPKEVLYRNVHAVRKNHGVPFINNKVILAWSEIKDGVLRWWIDSKLSPSVVCEDSELIDTINKLLQYNIFEVFMKVKHLKHRKYYNNIRGK